MYLASWMHRDVSTGNIILVRRSDGSQGGKLSDFEFAKEFDFTTTTTHTQSSDSKTVKVYLHTTSPDLTYTIGNSFFQASRGSYVKSDV